MIRDTGFHLPNFYLDLPSFLSVFQKRRMAVSISSVGLFPLILNETFRLYRFLACDLDVSDKILTHGCFPSVV